MKCKWSLANFFFVFHRFSSQIDILQTLKMNNYCVEKLSTDKLFYIDPLNSIVYSGQVKKIKDDEDKRSIFIELLKTITPEVKNLSEKYGIDAATQEELDKNAITYNKLVDELSGNTEDIDFEKLMAIFLEKANAENAAENASEAAQADAWKNLWKKLMQKFNVLYFSIKYCFRNVFSNETFKSYVLFKKKWNYTFATSCR